MVAHIQFLDCTSLNISFDIMGIASVTFSLISSTPEVDIPTTVFGIQGYVVYVRQEPLIEIPMFYTTQVTLKGVKNG